MVDICEDPDKYMLNFELPKKTEAQPRKVTLKPMN